MSEHTHDTRAVEAGQRTRARGIRGDFLIVAVLFGLLYAYDLLEAVTDLVFTPQQIASANVQVESLGLQPSTVPWVPLVLNVVMPVVAYVAAFVIARRQRLLLAALVFVAGLAAVAALTLSMYVFGMVVSS